jgi:ABC-2 type transport system ATP-binding protein
VSRKSRSSSTEADIPAIDIVDLTKEYGEITALAPVDMAVPLGEAVVLVGHNGSGKSTLLNRAAGNLEPTDGYVEVNGRAPGSIEARAELSWLPDTPILYDDLSVREHLEYVSRMHGGTGDEPLLDELVELLGLVGREDDLPSQFSRGMRQKTAIAVALCRPFSVLLVDEPFVGLDAAGRGAFLDLLEQCHRNGCTVVVATHDPDVIDRFDRGIMLENGEVVFDGKPKELPALMAGG